MTLLGAVLIPAAPVLLPELAGPGEPARQPFEAVLAALRSLIATGPDELLVVAEGDTSAAWDRAARWDLHRFGGRLDDLPDRNELPDAASLPPQLAVAAALIGHAGWTGSSRFQALERSIPQAQATAFGEALHEVPNSIGLVLVGNGSARSTPQAPGAFHADAELFNASLLAMVSSGDTAAMAALTAEFCAEQLSDIRLPLQVLAGTVPNIVPAGDVAFAEEFAGVFYLAARFPRLPP